MFKDIYEHLVEGEKPNPDEIFKSASNEEWTSRFPEDLKKIAAFLGKMPNSENGDVDFEVSFLNVKPKFSQLNSFLTNLGFKLDSNFAVYHGEIAIAWYKGQKGMADSWVEYYPELKAVHYYEN